MLYPTILQNVNFKYLIFLATQKGKTRGSKYVYFHIFKFYRI
jgi:hypothetical protein